MVNVKHNRSIGMDRQEAMVLQCAAMHTPPPMRLYAYIDESGQDTAGLIFVVGAVIVGNDHDEVLSLLEAIETRSRKRHIKWHRARPAFRQAYMQELVHLTRLRGCLFFAVFPHTRRYNAVTAEAAARAIRLKAHGRCKVTVLVDGLRKTERRAFTRDLRAARVNPYKVRGVLQEENNAMIRLADAICGLVRDADEGQAWAGDVLRRLHQRGLIVQT